MAQGTVLVVEDDAVVAGCIEDALRMEGYRVVVSAVSDPVAVAPAVRPDVIVLDLMTAGIDGVEVSRRLRATPETAWTPIVLLSEQVGHCPLDLPVDARLPKPCSLVSLCHLVEGFAQ